MAGWMMKWLGRRERKKEDGEKKEKEEEEKRRGGRGYLEITSTRRGEEEANDGGKRVAPAPASLTH